MGFNSFEFAAEVRTNLIGNLSTLGVGNASLNVWTTNNAALMKAWQVGDKNSEISEKIKNDVNNPEELADFLNKYLNNDNLYKFSLADVAALLTKVAGPCWDKDKGSFQMSEIQQFGNLISAQQQIETSTGDTETKAQASYLQQSTSAQQTVSDMGSSAVGILGSIAGLLNQSFL